MKKDRYAFLLCSSLVIFIVCFLLVTRGPRPAAPAEPPETVFEYEDSSSQIKLTQEQQRQLFERIKRMPGEEALSRGKSGPSSVDAVDPWVQKGPLGMQMIPGCYYSGRVNALSHSTGETYVGSANGGLWRLSWIGPRAISDDLGSLRIGGVAVDPGNADRIFLGTGDYDGNRNGAGTYRSTDHGASWQLMNIDQPQVSKIIVDGTHVYAAGNCGIFVSHDLGDTWEHSVGTNTCDIAVVAGTGIVYAALRGGHKGIYRSLTHGAPGSFVPINSHFAFLDTTKIERIAIAVAPSNPGVVYAQFGGHSPGPDYNLYAIYKTVNSGANWWSMPVPSENHFLQEFCNNAMVVNPVNSDIVWSGGTSLWRSEDGGSTWHCRGACPGDPIHEMHGDVHALMYDGTRLWSASDGGVFLTTDEGTTWINSQNTGLPLAQLYNIDVDHFNGGAVQVGGTQDNGIVSRIDATEMWNIDQLCDGNDVAIDQGNPARFYATYNAGGEAWRHLFLNNVDQGGLDKSPLSSFPDWLNSYLVTDEAGNLYTNCRMDPYWSTDQGANWQKLYGFSSDGVIARLSVAGHPSGELNLYATFLYTRVVRRYHCVNGVWTTNYAHSGLPQHRVTRKVRASAWGVGSRSTAFALMDHGWDGGRLIYRTDDAGTNWQDITGDLDSMLIVNDIVSLPPKLYIGTNMGAFMSTDNGTNWLRWTRGMPPATQILTMTWTRRDNQFYIIAGTYGRATFERLAGALDPNFKMSGWQRALAFGSVANGMILHDSVAVVNDGEAPLEISDVLVSDPGVRVSPPGGTIAPAESLIFHISLEVIGRDVGAYTPEIQFIHNGAGSPTRIRLETYVGDDTRFRTFPVESLLVKKEIKRKTAATEWDFRFDNAINTRDGAVELNVEFSSPVAKFLSTEPFLAAENLDTKGKKWRFTDGSVPYGSSALISCTTDKTRKETVKKWWWVSRQSTWVGNVESSQSIILGDINKEQLPEVKSPGLGMPNAANLRKELFLKAPFSRANPLIVGVPDPSARVKKIAYIAFGSESDVAGSLIPGRSGRVHDGPARPLSFFDNTRKMAGKISKLAPDKQSNRLFAELVALKLNIHASALRILPGGFGELKLRIPGHLLDGLMLKQIDSLGDRYMTYGDSSRFGTGAGLATLLHQINGAFVGPPDTMTFAPGLIFTGVRPVAEVSFLVRDSSIIPSHAVPRTPQAGTPSEFVLYQNYPNPFNPSTVIRFDLPQAAIVTLTVYNITGQEVVRLFDHTPLDDGERSIVFNGRNLASGVYFYRLIAEPLEGEEGMPASGSYVVAKKMILLR